MLSLVFSKAHTVRFTFQRTVGIINSLSSVLEMMILKVPVLTISIKKAESRFLFLNGYVIWRIFECFIGCICTCPKQYKFGILISWFWMHSFDIQFYVSSSPSPCPPPTQYTSFETSIKIKQLQKCNECAASITLRYQHSFKDHQSVCKHNHQALHKHAVQIMKQW